MAVNWFEYLQMEAQLAISQIATATLRADPENSDRCRRKTRFALAEIQNAIADPKPRGITADQVLILQKKRTEIENALAKMT